MFSFPATVLTADRTQDERLRPQREDRPWFLEVGLLVGSSDNFFSRGEGREVLSETLTRLYSMSEYKWRIRRSRIKLDVELGAVRTEDIGDASYAQGSAKLAWRHRRSQLSVEYFALPSRFALLGEDGVSYDIDGFGVEYRRVLRQGLWVSVGYEKQDQRYDPIEADRDSRRETLKGTVRFPLGKSTGLRASLFEESRQAMSPRYRYDGTGFGLRLEGSPSERLSFFIRFKSRDRDYPDALDGDTNFARADTIRSAMLSIRWRFSERLGLRLRDRYREGDSTRVDRNFHGNQIEAGIFVEL